MAQERVIFPLALRFSDEIKTIKDVSTLRHVHPLKQKCIDRLMHYLEEQDAFTKVILFGSSLRWDCISTSNVNLAVVCAEGLELGDTKEVRNKITDIVGDNDLLDVVDMSGNVLLCETIQEGLVLYEKS